MNTTYKSNNNIVYSCKYHVVWCSKYRRKVLTNGVDVRLKELLTEYAANLSVDILEMEIMPDHAHMLLEVDSQKADWHVQDLKTGISVSKPRCRLCGQTAILYRTVSDASLKTGMSVS